MVCLVALDPLLTQTHRVGVPTGSQGPEVGGIVTEMTLSRTRRVVFSALLAAALAAPTTSILHAEASTTSPAAAARTPYVLDHGETAPVYSYADAIRETVWVTAPDLDGDGEPDRVAVDIVRPRETDRPGPTVPVDHGRQPYYLCCGRGNESELKPYDADGSPPKFPLFYDNYFVPRGYAFAAVDMAGTARSTGCVDVGGRVRHRLGEGRRGLAQRPSRRGRRRRASRSRPTGPTAGSA